MDMSTAAASKKQPVLSNCALASDDQRIIEPFFGQPRAETKQKLTMPGKTAWNKDCSTYATRRRSYPSDVAHVYLSFKPLSPWPKARARGVV